jgi:hypothetical protein
MIVFKSPILSALAITVLSLSHPAAADDDKKQSCSDAYEQVQRARKAGKFSEAKTSATTCANPSCPDWMTADCTKWATEIESTMPSLVLEIVDDKDRDVVDAEITLDDVKIPSLGVAIPVDPGTHLVRIMRNGETTEQSVVALEGRKNRVIHIKIEKGGNATTVVHDPSLDVPDFGDKPAAGTDTTKETKSASGGRPLAWIFGSVGLAGVAGFAILGLTGNSKKSSLDNTCHPTATCTDAQVGEVKTYYALADTALGIGIVGLGLATFFFLKNEGPSKVDPQPAPAPASAHFDISPTPHGVFGQFSLQF